MTTGAVIEGLRAYAKWTEDAIGRANSMAMRAQMRKHLEVIACGANLCEQLQAENATLKERLLRQACWFEQFEAASQPKSYPLLRDEDEDDPGVAL